MLTIRANEAVIALLFSIRCSSTSSVEKTGSELTTQSSRYVLEGETYGNIHFRGSHMSAYFLVAIFHRAKDHH